MTGRVTDQQGNGLPAVVYISDASGKPLNDIVKPVLADAQGYYNLMDFASFGFYVSASITGWNRTTVAAFYSSNVNLILTPGNNSLPEINVIADNLRNTKIIKGVGLFALGMLVLNYFRKH